MIQSKSASRILLVLPLGLFCVLCAPADEPKPERTPPKIRPGGAAPRGGILANEELNRIRVAAMKGVFFLKNAQTPSGTWNASAYSVGYAAMPALAMLEVGVAPGDPTVQRAAMHVRNMAPKLQQTYELGLAILFLDKLGERRDLPIIRSLALRLIAGQMPNGGWSYTCPILNTQEEQILLTFLKRNQPMPDPLRTAHPFLVPLPKTLEPLLDPLTRREKDFSLTPIPRTGSLFDPRDLPLTKESSKDKEPIKKALKLDFFELLEKVDTPKEPQRTTPDPEPPADKTEKPARPAPAPTAKPEPTIKPEPPKSTPPRIRPAGGRPSAEPKPEPKRDPDDSPEPVELHRWASVPDFTQWRAQPKGKGVHVGREDNSNTQFAILGLWAARRHGSPVTLTLARLDRRFRDTQNGDGGWGYTQGGSTGAMTCVGLLGLGVAHGVFHDVVKATPRKEMLYDPAIQKGLSALSHSVGPQNRAASLYFLWSLERVGVMYHLPTLRHIDWHAWGTELLLPRQSAKGSWSLGGYPRSDEFLDTSMALLFLGRANLSRDLSESLRRNVVILDPAHLEGR